MSDDVRPSVLTGGLDVQTLPSPPRVCDCSSLPENRAASVIRYVNGCNDPRGEGSIGDVGNCQAVLCLPGVGRSAMRPRPSTMREQGAAVSQSLPCGERPGAPVVVVDSELDGGKTRGRRSVRW